MIVLIKILSLISMTIKAVEFQSIYLHHDTSLIVYKQKGNFDF